VVHNLLAGFSDDDGSSAMDKFATLEPTRLYGAPQATTPTPTRSIFSRKPDTTILIPTIGRLPIDLHLLILAHLPIPAFPAYSLTSRATARLSTDERIWERRWRALGVEECHLESVLDEVEARSRGVSNEKRAKNLPTIPVDDEFGDFTQGNGHHQFSPRPEEMGNFVGSSSFNNVVSLSTPRTNLNPTFRAKYQRAHSILIPLTKPLSSGSPPHIILSTLSSFLSPSAKPSATSSQTPLSQSKTLHLLSLFLSPQIQPLLSWQILRSTLRSTIDRFDATLLTAFDLADTKNDEPAMREAAEASWEVSMSDSKSPHGHDWEMGKVWAEKREIFYEQGQWNPLDNVTQAGALDFDAMDGFMAHIFESLREHGSRAVRVFPPSSQVLLAFAERVANEVVCIFHMFVPP
jgi:recyclin-1